MVGAIGDQQRLEFSVLGPPVNEASRIEAVAKENDVTMVVSQRVIDLAGGSVDPDAWRSLGNITLRGSSKPTTLLAFGH